MAWKNLVACLLVMMATNALADARTKAAKIDELMRLQGLTEMIAQQEAYLQQQAREIGPKMLAEFKKQMPQLPPELLSEIDSALDTFINAVKPDWTVAEATAKWGEYYGEQVTEAELDQIIAYYRSPIGQKDVLATGKAMPTWSAFFAERNNKVLDSALSAYVERLKAIVQQPPARKDGASGR